MMCAGFSRSARACPGQRPTRPPTGRALVAKVALQARRMVFEAPSRSTLSRPARVRRCPWQAAFISPARYRPDTDVIPTSQKASSPAEITR